ncbi:hypothetical protein [Leptolyngbya sp. FACHB-711]|uniref:hypothetical protein n=1 Tax=unclassified Leptolyngbya TaxID=2650499 RepID=UPI001689EA94|nr:hypothetical protein [Leptolyngbya sp. FACHB-711]MBD1849938.1 hypothetical protein [Cyanobacteria bacterium FACHB-502]MBD2025799.1 hypothetical protein [Leptolyngbya sp. FACHB-711]
MAVQQDPVQKQPAGVLHDSEQPLGKKPSFLFLVSTSIGVLTLLAIAAGAYYGIIRF